MLGPNYDILNYPNRIFNMNETAMYLSPKGTLIFGIRGKNVYDIGTSDNVTTLFAVNAAGAIVTPLTIYKFKRLPRVYAEATPKTGQSGFQTLVGCRANSFMSILQMFLYRF